MIGFALPLVLIALPVVGATLWFAFPRHRSRLVLRFLAMATLILALAQPYLSVRRAENHVIFLVDRSASVTRAVDDASVERELAAVVESYPDWQFGVIGFAESPALITPIGETFNRLPVAWRADSGSRFDDAVGLALSMLSEDSANQLVLISDGQFGQHTDAGVTAAQLSGVPISVLAVGVERPLDVQLALFSAPSQLATKQPFLLHAEIQTAIDTPASLALYRDGELISYEDVSLRNGTTSIDFEDRIDQPGFSEYTLVAKRADDVYPENDTRSILVQTVDRPSVLLVDGAGTSVIPSLLDSIGIAFATSTSVPSLTTLSQYRQLILTGLPLTDLTAAESTAIEQFVRNLGGGLLAVHGETEVRGFEEGPIDSLLPVSFTTPEQERDPSLAIIYLLDRSSSMSELVGYRAKIRILREAVAASIFLLPPDTLVGLLGFDDDYDWLFPIQRVGDATSVYRALQNLGAGGGTSLYPPVSDAIESLLAVVARTKHILLVSDGKTTGEEADYLAVLAALREHDEVTLSTIAVGEEPELALLGSIVQAGRGKLYHVADFLTLPQVTMQLTQRLSRSRFVTGEIAVSGALAERAGVGSIPDLRGYVLAYPRALSTTLLSADGDPVSATWRTGLGSVSILNTDLAGGWSERWLAWPGLAALFGKLLATTEPIVPSTVGILPSIEIREGEVKLLVDVRSADGGFANFLDLSATLLPTETELQPVQVAPGLYEARFPTPRSGGYAINIADSSSGRAAKYAFSVPFAAEYNAVNRSDAALQQIARATGGSVLPEERLLAGTAAGREAERPLFSLFILLALALFLIDLVARKWWLRRLPFSRRSPDD